MQTVDLAQCSDGQNEMLTEMSLPGQGLAPQASVSCGEGQGTPPPLAGVVTVRNRVFIPSHVAVQADHADQEETQSAE
ncbi:MAG: hypothetical protein GY696_12690 [Gammaproteobacteria bacterium]|nr:hypothetical protein [Gammaproteobacteria bacterium]